MCHNKMDIVGFLGHSFGVKTKSARVQNKSSQPLLWEMLRDDQLRHWPSGNKIRYFSDSKNGRYMPPENIATGKYPISQPERTSVDVWEKYEIPLCGLAEHTKGYYHSRVNHDFTDLLIVGGGVLGVSHDGLRENLARGDAVVVPPDNLCDSFVVNQNTTLYWFHFNKTPYWNRLFGEKIFTKKIARFGEISSLMLAFYDEIYAADRSVSVLENIAEAVVSVLRREFENAARAPRAAVSLIAEIGKNLPKKTAAKKEAVKLEISVSELNKVFKSQTGMTFAKFASERRMKLAEKLVKEGLLTNAQIASATGFSNAYSFSKAFKIRFGQSPKFFARDARLRRAKKSTAKKASPKIGNAKGF